MSRAWLKPGFAGSPFSPAVRFRRLWAGPDATPLFQRVMIEALLPGFLHSRKVKHIIGTFKASAARCAVTQISHAA
jgi:hypothetical protein